MAVLPPASHAGFLAGPAACDHCNCDHSLFRESGKDQSNLVQVLKQIAVTVAVVTVCWPHVFPSLRAPAHAKCCTGECHRL